MQMGVYIMELTEKKEFDLLSLGEIMLRLSPPDNERITRGDSFSKQAGGAELNAITGAAMLGLRCGIISKLPANDLGVSAMTIWYTMMTRMPDWACTTMRMVLTPESPVLYMTVRIPPSTS